MPNHVTTICTVTGPHVDVLAFAERHIVGDRFAFETIIPRPAILDETEAGSESEIGMAALVGDFACRGFAHYTWLPREIFALPLAVDCARRLREWLASERPTALEKGRKCIQAIAETGYPNWYQWSIANWGTKWGGYDYEDRERSDGRLVFKFETAWSFPGPIFRKLAELYPSLVLAVLSFDEGHNFACDGEFNGRNDYRCAKELATDEMYERVYGEKPDLGDAS